MSAELVDVFPRHNVRRAGPEFFLFLLLDLATMPAVVARASIAENTKVT